MKCFLLVILLVTLISCAVNKERKWGNVSFDKSLNRIWKLYGNEKEDSDVVMYDGKYNQSKLKTSHVTYFKLVQENKEKHVSNESENNCRVWLSKSDTLIIRVGFEFVFYGTGNGFLINYTNNKFYSSPYEHYHTQGLYPNAPIPKYVIKEQTLVLDKPNYSLGDSLYGKVYLHITETRNYMKKYFMSPHKSKIEHYASGNFRAIVKDALYW